MVAIKKRSESLTNREREVFKLVVTGMLNKQIASQLGITEKTIKVHRARIMQKMGVKSLADLVRLAERLE
jgi:FixJ family two-component response regulator